MQITRLIAITWENASSDLHTLPCIGRKAGENDATCLCRSSKRIEAKGDVGEKFGGQFGDHSFRGIRAALSMAYGR